uniref:Uncharacterized protein n=1 Tax=Setaria digitata TaxID=48799 RepID=A0A915PMA6_9BILA
MEMDKNDGTQKSKAMDSGDGRQIFSSNLSAAAISSSGDNDPDEPSCSRTGHKTKRELLQEHLKTLQATDSIMEPNVDVTIKGFLRSGGHPEVVINSLTDSYRGVAQFCELVGDWLTDLEGDRKVVNDCFEKSLSSLLEKRFVAEVVDKNFELCDDVNKWLPELLQYSTWRNLIYTLLEQNPRSKFLLKAIRLISDAGYQHEITNVRPAAQQLEIYCRMVLTVVNGFLTKLKKGPLTEDYEKAAAELTRIVCYSEHTYLFAQALLHEIIKEERNETAAAVCTHLSLLLRREAHKRNYQDTCDIHIALTEGHGERNSGLKQMIFTMLSKKCLNQADIIRLFDRYSSSEPPAVEFIQDPFFTDMLIDALFAYEGSKEEMKETKRIMEQVLDSIRSGREFLRDIRLLLNGIFFPSIASGLLHYLQGFLLSDEILSELEVVHFVLLDEIGTKHSGLHVRLFKLLCELYDRQTKLLQPAEMIIEKQRSIIDRFVHLLSVGFALPVVEKINKLFQEGQIDVSLVRYFAVDVLCIIEPPYSEEFVETFLPTVLNREIFDSVTLRRVPAAEQFIQDAKSENMKRSNEADITEEETTRNISEVPSDLTKGGNV